MDILLSKNGRFVASFICHIEMELRGCLSIRTFSGHPVILSILVHYVYDMV